MRGLVKAATATALLSVPAWASVHDSESNDINGYGAYVSLHVGKGQATAQTLRLDIRDSSQLCDASRTFIDGQSLPVNSDGIGKGQLKLETGSVVLARWELQCIEDDGVEVEQRLEVTLEAVDGEVVPDVSFIASFTPSAVAVLIESESLADSPSIFSFDELELGVVKVIEGGIEEPEIPRADDVQTPSPTPLGECSTWRCVTKSVKDRMKQKLPHWRRPHGISKFFPICLSKLGKDTPLPQCAEEGETKQFNIKTRPMVHQNEKPIKTPKTGSPTQSAPASSHTPLVFPSIPPADKDLFMTFCLAGLAFSIFSLFSIGILCRCCTPKPPQIQRRQSRRESQEERAARIESRKQAVRTFFRKMFCGMFDFTEKEEGESPQGRDLREGNSEDDTTMEQELARFREAASMVSSLIAAEEGRTQVVYFPPAALPPPTAVPDSIRAVYPGYNPNDTSLPTYEDDSVDASMVSDGFRYVPGERRYTPGASPEAGSQGQGGSDRLGYGNKD